jgi:tetratricopeptide (TPR) repeat protein
MLLRRPRRRPRSAAPMLSVWLTMGLFAAAALIWLAVQVNLDRRQAPVAGAGAQQQERIDALRRALERDSTDVQAHVGLGDVLYDTGNWADAIVHYRAALRRDSSLVTALVDLGVCYYNLSQPEEAERLFKLAIARDPHQPVALFNLGIVHERRRDYEQALQYFHRALESNPPSDMQQPLVESIRRIQEQTGRTAPPLSQPR